MQRKITNLCCICPFFLTIYFGANNNFSFVVRSHIISHQPISNFMDRPTSNKRAKFYALRGGLCFESGGFDGKEMPKAPMEVENVQEEIEENLKDLEIMGIHI